MSQGAWRMVWVDVRLGGLIMGNEGCGERIMKGSVSQ